MIFFWGWSACLGFGWRDGSMHGGMRWRIAIVAESGQLLDVAFEIYEGFAP